ncbi:predicted protein [Histoplasma capsulatum G186AR]|uniref:Uncharacterized protein n=1 Tax=Ajellomyces capsulatus (strain G186AR / H82 / ATCC MYA-2454 / RMSCC 2432) TaxID=447093 RepID=C0P066_AJECG|nr:uncharacterized protein HCBG_08785 [Histoplasma capsulatum G186AR]EEH02882.1 predicted protein [Histoplasma capsulatum G186AR]
MSITTAFPSPSKTIFKDFISIEFSLPHESDSEQFRYEGGISPKHTLQHGFRKAPTAIILQDMPRVEYYFTTSGPSPPPEIPQPPPVAKYSKLPSRDIGVARFVKRKINCLEDILVSYPLDVDPINTPAEIPTSGIGCSSLNLQKQSKRRHPI